MFGSHFKGLFSEGIVAVCVCVCAFVHKLMSEHGLCMCISLLHIHCTVLKCSTIIHAH